jgi:hypothetical protein
LRNEIVRLLSGGDEIRKKKNPFNYFMNLSESVNSRGAKTNRFENFLLPFKNFCTYLYLKGSSNYEAIYLNSVIPSISTCKSEITSNARMTIGKIYIEDFLNDLKVHNIECNKVIISEDATRIDSRIEYDSATNEIFGLLPEIDDQTGLPKVNFFNVTTPSKTLTFLKKITYAPYLQIIVAKPQFLGAFNFIFYLKFKKIKNHFQEVQRG